MTPRRAQLLDLGGRDHPEADLGVPDQVLGVVQRAADADVQAAFGVEEALLEGTAERGAVRVGGAEVGVPGVQVGVEVDDRDRAVHRPDRAQQRKRDRVVAAEGEQPGRPLKQAARAALDRGDSLVDVERVDAEVAGVRDLLGGERRDVRRRVVGRSSREDSLMWPGPKRAPGR